MIKEKLVTALLFLGRQIVGTAVERITVLVADAERELYDKPGTEKKAWLMAKLKQERDWFVSGLNRLPSTVSSAVVDVVIAWVKTK
jgi:hypothetical protein